MTKKKFHGAKTGLIKESEIQAARFKMISSRLAEKAHTPGSGHFSGSKTNRTIKSEVKPIKPKFVIQAEVEKALFEKTKVLKVKDGAGKDGAGKDGEVKEDRITYGPYIEKEKVKARTAKYKIAIIEGVSMKLKSGLLRLGVAKCKVNGGDENWFCWFVGKNELKLCTRASSSAQSAINQALLDWGWNEKPKRDLDDEDVNDAPTRVWISEILKKNENLETSIVEICGK